MKYPCSNPLRITFYALLPALLLAQAGWGPDVRLTYFWGYSYDPRAVCCGDTIHMVWWESYAHEEVFYKRSTDAGVTWEADVMLSVEDDDASVQPTIGVNGNFVHTVWKDEHTGVCYRKSTDGGNTWLQIDTLPDAGLIEPWIHVDGDLLYVLAGGGVAHQIFTKSTDNGITWQMGQIVVHSCGHPRIKKVDSLMLIISHQDNPGAIEIYCLRSTDDGQTWCDTTCVSQYDSVSGQGPAMDTDGSGGIHVCWFDYKYSPYPWTGDILYRASADSGNTWVDIDSLTVSHRAVLSDILVENNNLHLVWEDDRFDFNGNFEIFYRMSTDLGQTWGSEERLTDAPNWSRIPSLACDGHYLHLFWSDQRDDSSNIMGEIYYKRKDLSPGVAEVTQLEQPIRLWFDVYPTLFYEKITIKQSAWCMEQRGKEQLTYNTPMSYVLCTKVYDISGKELIAKRETEMGRIGETVQVDTKDLPCGVYFVELRVGSIREVHKVVKIK